jgi:Protein of unknown function (DUF3800)
MMAMTNGRAKKNINLADELRAGHHYGVFIDDTGSPGLSTPGLHRQRKTWIAVVVPPYLVADLMDQLLPAALALLSVLGLKNPEFHFADIWAGKGEYTKLNLRQRLDIFRFMSEIFVTHQLKVFVQTFDPDNAAVLHDRADWLPKSVGPLKLSSHEDLALFFLLYRVHEHLKEGNATACVIVDEGRLKSGSWINWSVPTFYAGGVLFANSRLVPLIQLADFAAYILNRWQLLRVKDRLNELDKTLLRIISPTTECFSNVSSLEIENLSIIASLAQGMIH